MSESMIQVIFAAVFYPILSFGMYFRLQAHKQQDRFERMKNEGTATFLILRICGGLLWMIAFLFPWFPGLFHRVSYEPLITLQTAGVLLSIISIPMGISVFTSIGKNITDTVETRKHHQLITNGIYRYIRHPLYTTGLFFFIGLGLLASNWLMLILSAAVMTTLYTRTFAEEERLIETFGDQYRAYMERTGKFMPRLF